MCEASSLPETGSRPARRRKLWEINQGWHCAIIGTCLTLGDLRVLGNKLGFRSAVSHNIDYVLHGAFVREAATASRPAKMLNKLLERKHAAAVRRFQKCTTSDALIAAWDEAFKAGDIPGPFWAALSHPLLHDGLGGHVYGDVHMLSHLVGGSNRASVAALHRLEAAAAEDQERRQRDIRRHRARLAERDDEIATLRGEVADLRAELSKAREPRFEPQPMTKTTTAPRVPDGLRQELAAALSRIQSLQRSNRQLASTVPLLQAEIRALESSLTSDETADSDTGCAFDLDGRCILYVGGRAPHVCRLRALVQAWNGELMHHDGGIEKSIDDLARAVTKADTVVFPTDCVSHSAVLKVKRLCRQTMKPFVPLRTTGVASFVAGLRTEFKNDPSKERAH